MAITIRSPRFSFVQLDPQENYGTCSDATAQFCLPVQLFDDIAFQFVIVTDTKAEADALCGLYADYIQVALHRDCEQDADLILEDLPEVTRISEKEVLVNWEHGFPGFDAEFEIGECFRIKITVEHPTAGTVTACSNCFERISPDCYTSVIDYGATENMFDFNYCGAGAMFDDEEETVVECVEPTIIPFTDAPLIDIPYTPAMQAKYGSVPTVELWILEGGEYVQPFVRAGFDAYPPTRIIADLGGAATGYIKIS
jgi:hypothetical protein